MEPHPIRNALASHGLSCIAITITSQAVAWVLRRDVLARAMAGRLGKPTAKQVTYIGLPQHSALPNVQAGMLLLALPSRPAGDVL